MDLQLSELKALNSIAEGNIKPAEIARAIKKSKPRVYKIINSLNKKGVIEISQERISIIKQPHLVFLIQVIKNNQEVMKVLSSSGIEVLTSTIYPKTIKKIMQETTLKKSLIYLKLKKARNLGAVKKIGNYFQINEKIWPKLRDFLLELSKYEQTIDTRIPLDSIIYLKNDKELLYSTSKQNISDAIETAFSVYGDYGIKLLGNENFYYLPKKKLNKKDIFSHSLIISEKRQEIRLIIYTALFYLKFKEELKKVKHPLLEKIKEILAGKEIKDYPSLYEIKEKAEIYDVQI